MTSSPDAPDAWSADPRVTGLPEVQLDPTEVEHVVVLAAHPGEDLPGAGGLVARARRLGIRVSVVVATEQDDLLVALVALVRDGRRTLLVAPWRHDGDPDRETAGRAAATAAARTSASVLEYPVGSQGQPEDAPWDRLRVLHTDTATHELYVDEGPSDLALDDLHARDEDPWGTESRWYEIRKRSLLLAALPRAEFRHGLEIGSSTGALASDLATRCEDLLVVDAGGHAVAAARDRLRDHTTVRVEQRAVPDEWPEPPEGGFDLVVLSEVGYFLSPRDLDDVIGKVRSSLAADGVLVLCHWRHPMVGWPLDGPAVHEIVTAADVRPVVAEYRDEDFELLVLAASGALPDPAALR